MTLSAVEASQTLDLGYGPFRRALFACLLSLIHIHNET